MLSTRFPDYAFHTGITSRDRETLDVFSLRFPSADGPDERMGLVPSAVLDAVRSAVFDFYATDIAALAEAQEVPTPLPPSLPPILQEFLVEIEELYGMLVETDLAMLMAADHFRQAAQAQPYSRATFSRGTGHPQYQYEASAEEIADNLAHGGRDRILRNRSLVVFLYELWDHKYQKRLAVEAGKSAPGEIRSGFFGDLRLYRNSIAHARGRLERATKTLRLVEVGETVDLVSSIDDVFRLAVEELNRLASTYLGVDARASLDKVSNAIPVAQGDYWIDGPRSRIPE